MYIIIEIFYVLDLVIVCSNVMYVQIKETFISLLVGLRHCFSFMELTFLQSPWDKWT